MTTAACVDRLGDRLSGAEALAVGMAAWLALTLGLAYAADAIGLGLAPIPSLTVAAVVVAVCAFWMRSRVCRRRTDLLLLVAVSGVSLAFLLGLTWPALLPPGSGPDLTHHLLLVDYLQRHGTLVHDPGAGAALGEMADYTPGLHILAYVAGQLWRIDPFHTVYPVVAVSVALKLGLFVLVLLRVFDGDRLRMPSALMGLIGVAHATSYTVGSFLQDSFLAQVVSELFALVAWWALVWWDQAPSRAPVAVYALACSAVFLTWPVWTGPLMLALGVLVLLRNELPIHDRVRHVGIAVGPVAIVIAFHAIGRTSWVSILGTSGAVTQPSPEVLGWWLLLFAAGGLVCASIERRGRVIVVIAGALAAQALALWFVARAQGAETPYMAIKMIYFGIYPAIASAVMAFACVCRALGRAAMTRHAKSAIVAAWIAVVIVGAGTFRRDRMPRLVPVVSSDLFEAGQWARTHVPAGCVDYLVGNDYTAYWLHLAVLGNPRASDRTANDGTFATQPSFARWLVPGAPRYAVANLAVLPTEIRRDVDVLTTIGQAAVISRRGDAPCP